VHWLAEEHGLDTLDAYQLVSQISESPDANFCDPKYTFVAKAPKRYLPNADVYGATRTALKDFAAAYLRERGGG
jgi:amidase